MPDDFNSLSPKEAARAKQRRLEAMRLQEIEGNPLDADQIATFEMFERERWPHTKRRAFIMSRIKEKIARRARE